MRISLRTRGRGTQLLSSDRSCLSPTVPKSQACPSNIVSMWAQSKPPGQRSRDPTMVCRTSFSLALCSRWFLFLFFFRSLSVFCLHCDGRVFLLFDRPSVGPKPSGSTSFYCVDDRICYLGGGFSGRGRSCISSVSRTPKIDPWRVWGGPWAPPPRLSFASKINDSALGFLAFILLGLWVRLFFFCSEAEIFCPLLFCPWRPDPCENCCCINLFLLLFGLFFGRRRRVIFHSSPGAGMTQTALRFVVSLVSLRPGHGHRPRPVLLRLQLHLGQRPRLFFLFVVVPLWWVSVCFGCGGPLSLSLSLVRGGVWCPVSPEP